MRGGVGVISLSGDATAQRCEGGDGYVVSPAEVHKNFHVHTCVRVFVKTPCGFFTRSDSELLRSP